MFVTIGRIATHVQRIDYLTQTVSHENCSTYFYSHLRIFLLQ